MNSVVRAGLVLLFALVAFAQEFRATIGGAVTDTTGAAVANARVVVTEINTGTKVETVTDSSGHYTAAFLLPGDYEVAVRIEGFKEFVRRGIHAGAGEHPLIDAALTVGDAKTTLEVTADAPLLVTENASVGQAITSKEVEDLPINGRTPMMMVALSMGVVATGQPSQVLPFAPGGGAAWSIGGMPNQTNELLIDGSPNTTWDGRLAYSPPQDAVQEVRVKAFDTDAAYGRTAAGTANQILKSGTNAIHGSLNWYTQPTNMTANGFFSNKNSLPVTKTHYNQYGGTVGGPVVLPKLYDGHNKLFWFFAFDGVQDSTPATTFLSVPTLAQRTGDFSKLLTLASPTVLYDPYSAVLNGTTTSRTAYPGNKIPATQLSPIALKMLAYYPAPNVVQPGRTDDFNNFGSNAPSVDGYSNEFGRIDYNINNSNRTYVNVRHTDYFQNKNDYFDNIATGSYLSRENWGISLDHVLMVNATNVINIRTNFTRLYEDHSSPSAGFDPAQLGFPGYLGANSQYPQLPYINFATNSNIGPLGANGANKLPSQSAQLYVNWVTMKGSHTIKTGADARQYRFNNLSYGSATGNFSFTANSWVRASSGASSTVAVGQDLAEFLLGLPTGGSYDNNASGMYYSYYGALFVQDDWRVRRNLTVNLGARMDHDFPYHEKWARTVNGFAFDATNPLAAAAQAAYAKAPIPQLAPGAFRVPGGLTFADPNNTAIYTNSSYLVSPRVGLAWTPDALKGNTVIRAGFGMFVASVPISTLQISGAYSTNPILTQQGFSQSTPVTPTNNNYLTPNATLSNPFPTGLLKPAGATAGLLTFAGQSVNFLNPEVKSPYSLRWNFGFQQQLMKNTILEVVYMGNHGVHTPVTYTQLNGIPRQFLSTQGTRDQALITSLTGSTANPFFGLSTQAGTSSTTTPLQLLSNYPEFPAAADHQGSSGVVEQNLNVGSSYFESANVRLTHRLSNGLSLTFNFMRSRLMDQTIWLNDSDPRPEKRISPFDHTSRFVTAILYELPFGKGKRFGVQSRLLDAVVGGWKLNNIYTYQTGAPLTWINGSTNNIGDYVYFGGPLDLQNRVVDGTAFNTAAFATKATEQVQYHVRTFSTAFGNLRQDGINDWNASLIKQFVLGEKKYFQVRFESFNVINHPTFSAPNTQPTNTQFGVITGQANRPRSLQGGLRLVF